MSRVRWMTKSDIPGVLKIPPVDNIPLFEEEILSLLSERYNIAMVAIDDNQIKGYVFYNIDSKNELGQVIFIFKLAFDSHETFSLILKSLKRKLNEKKQSIEIYVQETNLALQNMLKSEEFLAISIIADYYTKPDNNLSVGEECNDLSVEYEDAYHMRHVI
jgi:hypothetical protein